MARLTGATSIEGAEIFAPVASSVSAIGLNRSRGGECLPN
jgi:hypothetical protein